MKLVSLIPFKILIFSSEVRFLSSVQWSGSFFRTMRKKSYAILTSKFIFSGHILPTHHSTRVSVADSLTTRTNRDSMYMFERVTKIDYAHYSYDDGCVHHPIEITFILAYKNNTLTLYIRTSTIQISCIRYMNRARLVELQTQKVLVCSPQAVLVYSHNIVSYRIKRDRYRCVSVRSRNFYRAEAFLYGRFEIRSPNARAMSYTLRRVHSFVRISNDVPLACHRR